MWELDHKEGWGPKNWYFPTVVLEKTLESLLDCKGIKPINSEGSQFWIFIARTDAEPEAPMLWLYDAKSWLTGKDPDSWIDLGQEEKTVTEDKTVGWHHQLNGHEFEQICGMVKDREAWCAAVHGIAESDTTEWLNTTTGWLWREAVNPFWRIPVTRCFGPFTVCDGEWGEGGAQCPPLAPKPPPPSSRCEVDCVVSVTGPSVFWAPPRARGVCRVILSLQLPVADCLPRNCLSTRPCPWILHHHLRVCYPLPTVF